MALLPEPHLEPITCALGHTVGQGVDERDHGGRGEIQERGGMAWGVEHVTQRSGHRFKGGQQSPSLHQRVTFGTGDTWGAQAPRAWRSVAPLVPQITLPCCILFAAADLVVDATVFEHASLPPHVQVVRTAHGGHMGFLGIPGRAGGYRLMDAQLLAWLGVSP
jgi:hypothetical protein